MKNQAFTLIELLVVVLIIGILAAIAMPQYQKAVMKADLHRGIPLVESLYQAQQAYFLATGDFAGDVDLLDVSIPKDSSCTKGSSKTGLTSWYDCDFGRVYNSKEAVQFQNKPAKEEFEGKKIAYSHRFKDNGNLEAGKRYCSAKPNFQISIDVCEEMGGVLIQQSTSWIIYELP